ncbi:MAG: hypothetical protein KatS3mg079_689 [Caloramator sp.]|nr:MAG: hypothetical protein KatS3mg079_689 [Caloramator sp.]
MIPSLFLNINHHLIDGYLVQDNTPAQGFISWSDLHITYKGITYNIQDGYTNYKYAWWDYDYPNNLVVGDTLPTLTDDDVLLFFNKNGIHMTIPKATVIDGGLIVSESIMTNAIAANAITSEKIAAGAVTASEIAANAIQSMHIAAGAITADKIAANAIGASAIAAGVITGDKLVADTITAREIAPRTITANEIAANTITAGSAVIADGAITTAKIADGSITNAKIADLDATKITTGVLTVKDGTNGAKVVVKDASNSDIVTLDTQGVTIKTGGLSLQNDTGDIVGQFFSNNGNTILDVDIIQASNISASNIITIYDTISGQAENIIYVNGSTGNDLNSGLSSDSPLKSINTALSMINKYVRGTVTIQINGICNEDVLIEGFMGSGSLTLKFNSGATIEGSLNILNNTLKININGYSRYSTSIKATSSKIPLYIFNCTAVYVGNLKIDARGLVDRPLHIEYSRCYIGYLSLVGGTNLSMAIKSVSTVYATNCIGNGTIYIEGGSRITFRNSRPNGSYSIEGGSYTEFSAAPTSDTGETKPTTITETIYCIDTWSYNYKYSSWKSDNRRPYQGQWQSYGLTQGFVLYSATDIDKFMNRTILKVTLTIKRYNGGGYTSSLANGLTLRYHNLSSLGGSAPSTNFTYIKNIDRPAWGGTLAVDITNDIIKNALKAGSGTFRGFSFYTTNGSSTYYCVLEDKANCNYALTVTYQ